MEITQTPFAQMLAPDAAAQAEIAVAGAFAAALAAATNGAPPGAGGPEPPGIPAIVGEEAANLEPNALSQKPDFLPLPDLSIEMPDEFWPPAEPQIETRPTQEEPPDVAAQETVAAQFAVVLPPVTTPPTPTIDPSRQVECVEPTPRRATVPTMDAAALKPVPGNDLGDVAAPKDAPAVSDLSTTPAKSTAVPQANVTPTPDRPTLDVRTGDRIVVDTSDRASHALPTLTTSNPAVEVVERQSATTASMESEPAVVETTSTPSQPQTAPATKSEFKKSTLDVDVVDQQGTTATKAQPTKPSSDAPADGSPKQKGDAPKAEAEVKAAKVDTDPVAPVATKASATTEAAPKVEPLSRGDRENVIRQIGDRMELLAATRPREGVTIHLQPANMGSITMVVKSIGAAIDAQIFASNDDVRASLDGNRPELVRAMDARGFNLQTVTVAAQTPDHRQFDSQTRPDLRQQQEQQQGQASTHRQHQQSSARGDSFARPFDEPADNRPALLSGRGVDLWI